MKVEIDTASPGFANRLSAARNFVNNLSLAANVHAAAAANLTLDHIAIIRALDLAALLNINTITLEMDDLATLLLVEHCIKVSYEPNDILDPIEDEARAAQENAE